MASPRSTQNTLPGSMQNYNGGDDATHRHPPLLLRYRIVIALLAPSGLPGR
ncbi:hypothetical protein PIN31115_00637 [Pandoraea iniqua]|uniref:Uncharacterized protein n=1 Tax=Pandoraea iniqua TaxID=2508288 RepID=A0A5E4SBX1_9BURK|nr:hypothetical protein PIN31115_00637 [Pandoraea iniqua]